MVPPESEVMPGAPNLASGYGTTAVANGGTGITSYTIGDILYASASGVLSKLADVATGQFLKSGGVGTAPAWGHLADQTSFRVRLSGNQTVSTATWTKAVLDTEDWDIAGWYDATTNYRYTPLIAGTYIFAFSGYFGTVAAGLACESAIYKNGTAVTATFIRPGGTSGFSALAVGLVQMNGTTDYIEFFVKHNQGSDQSLTVGAPYTYATGGRVL